MSFKRIIKDKTFNTLNVTDPFQPNGGLIQPSSLEFTVNSNAVIEQLDLSSSGRTIGLRLIGNGDLFLYLPENAPSGYTVRFVVIENTANGFNFRIGQQFPMVSSLTQGNSTTNPSGSSSSVMVFDSNIILPGDYIEYTKVGDIYAVNGVAQNATSFTILL